MNKNNYFFTIFFLTILFIRIFLFFKPISSATVTGFEWFHHYIFGLVLFVSGLLVSYLIIYSIGLGLFVDELTFLLINGNSHEDNYSIISLSGTVLFVLIIFFSRKFFVNFFEKIKNYLSKFYL